MQARKVPVALLLLLLTIEAIDVNRKNQIENILPITTNICDVNVIRDSKVHCYCEFEQEINKALKTDCWVFNENIEETNLLWSSFISQTNIENLEFDVRVDGGMSFVPSKIFIYLKKIKQFTIKHSSIHTIKSSTFANLTSVQKISLTKNQIMHLSRHSFSNLPNMAVLSLDKNQILELVTETFHELPALQKLNLESNNISVIQAGAFRHLGNLTDLNLDQNNISELKKECFEGLANLKRLDLRNNKINALNSFIFTEFWCLDTLLLDHNKISVLAKRSFDGLSQLRMLSLSHNKLETIPSKLLEGVRGLTALDLRNNKLKLLTLKHLLPIYDNLKTENSYIYLEGNKFPCDCNLEWVYKLKHETSSIKLRTVLESFICKLDIKQSSSSQFTYYEKSDIGSKAFYEIDGKTKIKDYSEVYEYMPEESDNVAYDEPKSVKEENDRTLLQIPFAMLPCVREPVTEKIHPSQIEAKDRNAVLSSSAKVEVYLIIFTLTFIVL